MDKQEYLKAYHADYRKRVKYLNVALPLEDYHMLRRRADSAGEKPTAHLRSLALSTLKRETQLPPDIADELKQVRLLMRNIANNINQNTRHSHTLRVMVDERGLLGELHKLEKLVTAYTERRLREQT